MKKIQIFGAGAFVAFALVFAAAQVLSPVASAAQGNNCCMVAQDCAPGMACTGPTTNCGPHSVPYKGSCVQVTPAPQTPITVPSPIGGDN